MEFSQCQPSPQLKHGDLQGHLLVNVYTSVHAYDDQIPHPMYRASFSVKSKSNAPPFPLYIPGGWSGA